LKQDKKLQIKTLGNEGKVNYFKRLAKKEGSGQKAIRKLVREDGSERSLKDLQRLYGKPSDITIKIPKPKPVTKPVAFERRLVDSSPDQLRKDGKALIDEVGGLDVDKLKKLEAEFKVAAKEAARDMGAFDKFEKVKKNYFDFREKFEARLTTLRNKMLETTLNDAQINKYIKNTKITTWNAAQKTEIRGQLDEYIRMFNGNGFIDAENGVPAITKIGKASRASNSHWKGSITTQLNRQGKISKSTTFHEITHSVEVMNPKLNNYMNEWKFKRAFTDNAKIKEVINNKRAYAESGAVDRAAGKPIYKLKDITNIRYEPREKAFVDKYLDPYMGKKYEPYDYTRFGIKGKLEGSEVLTMTVQQFGKVENMAKLYREHQDLFEIIVGMSRAKGL